VDGVVAGVEPPAGEPAPAVVGAIRFHLPVDAPRRLAPELLRRLDALPVDGRVIAYPWSASHLSRLRQRATIINPHRASNSQPPPHRRAVSCPAAPRR